MDKRDEYKQYNGDCLRCSKCFFCITCGDCAEFGCGRDVEMVGDYIG